MSKTVYSDDCIWFIFKKGYEWNSKVAIFKEMCKAIETWDQKNYMMKTEMTGYFGP